MVLRHFFVIVFLITAARAVDFSQDVIQTTKRGVVSILTKIHKSAYNAPSETGGSGFLVDRNKGLIITNRHVVGSATIARYEVTFFNGKQADAQLIYYDPIYDVAVLKVDIKDIPSETHQLSLKPNSIQVDKDVFIIGKNAGQDFSFQMGRITSLFETNGLYPVQAVRVNVNNRGGSSGSAVCDSEGHVVGIIHSSNMDSYGFALWSGYIDPILKSLQKNERPLRKSIGAVWGYYSIDRAMRYLEFPSEMAVEYTKKFPESRNQMICIQTVLNASPAQEHLQAGDLIWKANGKMVGPHIHLIEEAINTSTSSSVLLTIVRDGKTIDIELPTYDLLQNQIHRMISFAGANFYESDELIRYLTGLAPRTILISYIQPGTGLHQRFNMIPGLDLSYIKILKIGPHMIRSFADVKKAIRKLKGQSFFQVLYENYGVWVDYDRFPILSHPMMFSEGDISHSDNSPLLHTLTPEGWKTKELWKPNLDREERPVISSAQDLLMQK